MTSANQYLIICIQDTIRDFAGAGIDVRPRIDSWLSRVGKPSLWDCSAEELTALSRSIDKAFKQEFSEMKFLSFAAIAALKKCAGMSPIDWKQLMESEGMDDATRWEWVRTFPLEVQGELSSWVGLDWRQYATEAG